MFLFHTSKIEEPTLSIWVRSICAAQRKFEHQGFIKEVKQISALINDWENIIAYWEESKQRKALADKCDSLYTVNDWWIWGRPAQPQENFAIYTLI